ncbi:secreted RxLR effector protein 161-like [Solanum lycopersicum]|uniref:secreted RxLR effector protein 161-like n=1 Tax=Solanum lycopersicum TaxID=4081 RepID=UPI0008FEC9FC
MQDCKPVSTRISTGVKLGKDEDFEKVDDCMYGSLIGSLLYLTASRPDILFVVSFISRFMHSPRDTHLTAAKRVLRYIKGTSKFGIFFPTSVEVNMNLIGYSNTDWGGGVDDSRSTSGYLFCLGTSYFSWISRKQETTAQSTAEAEYIVVASVVNQAIWLRKMMKGLGHE